MRPLVIIPAREGSKGVPGKNIKLLNGKPLIHYTIEVAQKIFDNKNIYVSTDSLKIKSISEETGLKVPFLRPKHLSTDTANMRDVILNALEYFVKNNKKEPDVIILLQPTSPFRKVNHIIEALKLYNNSLDMVVSVKETSSNPYYVLYEENKDNFLRKSKESNFTRRQDCPKVWEYNGSIYIINVTSIKSYPIGKFKKAIKYQMDETSSHDIDSKFDWLIAENLIKNTL